MGVIDLVAAERHEALRALLARDPIQNLFLLAVIEEYALGRPGLGPMAFYGQSEGELGACVFVGGEGELMVPSGEVGAVGEISRSLAERGLRPASATGERGAVDAMLRSFGAIRLKIDRTLKLCAVSADDLGPFVAPQLSMATEADLPELLALNALALREAADLDAAAVEGPQFERRVAARIRAGRTWVMRLEGKLCFKVDMGPRSRHGAELENVFLLPEFRRRGLGTLGLGQVCRQQLAAIPRLTFRFDEHDASLAGVCRKVGFISIRAQRLVVAE